MRRDTLARAAGGGVLALLCGLALLLSGPGATGRAGSATSVEPDGRLAVYLLLEELGFRPRAWRGPPALLPRDARLLWMAEPPDELSTASRVGAERSESERRRPAPDALDRALAAGPRSPLGYRSFLEAGGTLALGAGPREEEFLVDVLGLEDLAGLFEGPAAGRPEHVRDGAGRLLRIDWSDADGVDALAPVAGAEPWLETEEGAWLAAGFPVGAGTVLVLAPRHLPRNDALRAGDHALLLAGLVERVLHDGSRTGPVLFDEYALGLGTTGSPLQLAFGRRAGPFGWSLLALLALATWRLAWVGPFPRDPEDRGRVSPLARAEAEAGLLERAGRFDLIAHHLRRGVLRSQGARAGPRPAGQPGPGQAGDAWRDEVEAWLAQAGLSEAGRAEWRDLLLERRVRTRAELADLDRDLLERSARAAAGP